MNQVIVPVVCILVGASAMAGISIGDKDLREMRDTARVCKKSGLETVVTTTWDGQTPSFSAACK